MLKLMNKHRSMRSTITVSALALIIAGMAISQTSSIAQSASKIPAAYADPAKPALPQTTMTISLEDTALVITDPQIDFLSPKGVTWGVVGESVTEHNTVENIGRLLETAKAKGLKVFISPHHYYKTDHSWKFEGPLEKLMHSIGMFDRKGPYTSEGFVGSGSDFMPQYKKHIHDGETVITSPHKIYGPETNDLVLQLRKQGIKRVILGGMSANLCTQAHLYELLEQGFEVGVVRDATAAAKLPEGDGYQAAITNFRFVANELWTTDEVVELMLKAK